MAFIKYVDVQVCILFHRYFCSVLFIIDGTLQSEDEWMSSTEATKQGRSNPGVSAFKDEESTSLYGELDFPWIK